MIKIAKIIVVALLFMRCTTAKIDFFESEHKIVYKLDIPNGYKKQIKTDYHGKKVFYFMYKEQGTLYFTDSKSGLLTDAKTLKYGKNIYDIMYISDTMNIYGRYKGFFWRELKNKNIIIGFSNVDSLNLIKFNNIVTRQKIKKK